MREFRPHKGGYIGDMRNTWRNTKVPPSQGRVYRFCIDNMDDLVSSALTRAGISPCNILSRIAGEFRPHKGGYIDFRFSGGFEVSVPPSQGRVYHKIICYINSVRSSALTRAGIKTQLFASFFCISFLQKSRILTM